MATTGEDLGDKHKQRAVAVRALYGLRSSGKAFVAYVRSCMRELGFEHCNAAQREEDVKG
jgi:hypothetical protein